MACGVALKRSLDFDTLHNSSPPVSCDNDITAPSSKRRKYSIAQRCGSITSVTSAPPSVSHTVWRRYNSTASNISASEEADDSPFAVATRKCAIPSEQIVKHVYQEYKRLKKRKQLSVFANPSSVSNSRMLAESSLHPDHPSHVAPPPIITLDPKNSSSVIFHGKQNPDAPSLSIKQVGLICERLLKEQQERLCFEYEKALVNKLSEQYDAFVKFSHDQLRQQLQGRPASYVS